MSFFSWLSTLGESQKKLEIEDPFFGKLKYETAKQFSTGRLVSWWQGEMLTPLACHPISIYLEVDENGPDEYHYALMNLLYEQFSLLKEPLGAVLFEEWMHHEGSCEEMMHLNYPEKMLEIHDLGSVKLCADERFYYELGFNLKEDLDPCFARLSFIAIDAHWNVSFSGGAG